MNDVRFTKDAFNQFYDWLGSVKKLLGKKFVLQKEKCGHENKGIN